VKLQAGLASASLAAARALPTVRTASPKRRFRAAKACSTRGRIRARRALPQAMCRGKPMGQVRDPLDRSAETFRAGAAAGDAMAASYAWSGSCLMAAIWRRSKSLTLIARQRWAARIMAANISLGRASRRRRWGRS